MGKENEKFQKEAWKQALMPRERLDELGAEQLSLVELFAILLRTGNQGEKVVDFAHRVLHSFDSLQEFKEASIEELMLIKGVGKNRAIEFKAMIEIGKRFNDIELKSQEGITTSHGIGRRLLNLMKDLDHETFIAIYLDNQNRPIRWMQLFSGTLNQSIAHPREIFKYAVKYSAASMIVAHNHPSGNVEASMEDRRLTERICKVGIEIGIPLLDHLIIGKKDYFSFREKGFL